MENYEHSSVLLLEYDNFYWKSNPEMFCALCGLIREHPTGFGRIINSSKCDKRLSHWVNAVVTKLADPVYKTTTKITWIMTGQTDFKKCTNPKCDNLIEVGMNFSLSQPRRQYCCPMCQKTSPVVAAKKHNIMLSHLDEDPEYFDKLEQRKKQTKRDKGLPENWCNGDKIRETFRLRYEADPGFWKKREAKSQRTRTERGFSPNWHNEAKAYETRLAKNGGKFESEETKAKRRETSRSKYGYDSPNSSPVVKQNKRASCVRKYGVDSPMKLESVRSHLGDVLEERYGVRHVMQLKSVQKKAKRKYFYNGQYFSSADEICFMIYHIAHGHAIIYQPDIAFSYEFEGKAHMYHPDFILDGAVIEIKGDQFFKEDGTMFCPYRNKNWTDADYERRCAREEAKHQCMLRNGVRIIRTLSDDMCEIRKYVNDVYGKNYVADFRCGVNSTHEECSTEAEGPSREDQA